MDDQLSPDYKSTISNSDDFSEHGSSSHERWLVSYADFMTLLMAFFVVMYSLSQVSDDHFRVLGEALDKAFSAEQLEDPVVNEGVPQLSYTSTPIDLEGNALEDHRGNDSNVIPENFVRIDESEEQNFEQLNGIDPQSISGNERWMQIEISSEILFESGGAKLSDQAKVHLAKVAEGLLAHGKEVRVEGFTDNKPVTSSLYPSNWELSAARAAGVVRFLVELGIDPNRLSAIGYGAHYPVATNGTEEGRKANRRIVLSVSAHDANRPDPERFDDALRARKRFYPYEQRESLPEGVKVYGLEQDIKQAASSWLNARMGRVTNFGRDEADVVSYESRELSSQKVDEDASSTDKNNSASL